MANDSRATDPRDPQGWSRVLWNREEGRLPAGWRILLLLVATLATQIVVYSQLSRALEWSPGTTRIVYLLAAFAVLLAASRLLDRRSLASLGLTWRDRFGRGFGRDLALGLALGAAAVAAVFLGLWTLGWLEIRGMAISGTSGGALWGPLAGALGIFALTGFYEETLCRGYLLRNVAEGVRGRAGNRPGAPSALVTGWIVSSLLFGLMHAGNPNAGWLGLVNVVLLGAVFALPYLITGSLAVPVGLHIAWNFVCGPLLGLPVSGSAPSHSLLAVQVQGPTLWTGTSFGPEGGLLVTGAALLLAGALIALLRRRSEPSAGLTFHAELAQPPARLGSNPEHPAPFSHREPDDRASTARRRPPAAPPGLASPAPPAR